jgi:uncharacterized protein YacL
MHTLNRMAIIPLSIVGGLLLSALSSGTAIPIPIPTGIMAGLAGGLAAFALLALGRARLASVTLPRLVGLGAGLLIANLLTLAMGGIMPTANPAAEVLLLFVLSAVLGTLGYNAHHAPASAVGAAAPVDAEPAAVPPATKILDTSVIIDGRIADIVETGFLDGDFIVPHFVLRELQHIADSSDSLKRNRGRRGLEILQRLQKREDISVRIVETDFPRIREVDGKLIALAKSLGGRIITNDFNLNKIAELQGVIVLNINQLANSLKPVVLPGEQMSVYILKEGKEAYQGVAYLDDGTMVVIDNGKKEIGRTVDVLVTSVLQTTAGRMIFTQIKEDPVRVGA